MKKIFNIILFLAPNFLLFGQFNYEKEFFDLKDAKLNGSNILSISKDKKEQLWLQSFSEISRFDGNKFYKVKTNNVVHNAFLGIYDMPTKENPFAIDFFGGLFFIDNDSLIPFKFNNKLQEYNKRLLHSDVYFDTIGRLHFSYFGNGYRIMDLEGKVTKPEFKNNLKIHGLGCIFGINEDPFMFTNMIDDTKRPQSFYLFDENLEVIDSINLIDQNFPKFKPRIVKLSNGNFLISNSNRFLHEFNEKGIVKSYEFKQHVVHMLVDASSHLWITTYDKGIMYYPNDTIIDDSVKTVLFEDSKTYLYQEDYEGGLWHYDFTKGLFRNKPTIFNSLNKENNLLVKNKIRSTYVSEKEVLVGHNYHKASKINLDSNYLDSTAIHFPREILIYEIFRDRIKNRIWLSTSEGIFYEEKDRWNKLAIDSGDIVFDRNIFFPRNEISENYSLLGRRNKRYFLVKDTSLAYVSEEFPSTIKKVIFFNGLRCVFTLKGVYLEDNEKRIFLGHKHPIMKTYCYYSFVFNNNLWFAFPNGTYRLEEDSLIAIKYQKKIISNAALLKQNQDTAWIFSPQGTFLLQKDDNGSVNYSTVLKPQEFANNYPYLYSNSNSLFIETETNGLLQTTFKKLISEKLSSPKFQFTNLKVNQVKKDISDSTYVMNYDEGFLQIKYQGISYEKQDIRYRFRMNGISSDWEITDENNLQFTTLPSGNYQLDVQVQFLNQPWSSSHSLNFKVLKPLWETWWFLLSAVFLVTSIIYMLFRLRLNVVENEKKLVIGKLRAEQRALRAKMNPHFIFNVISSLQYLIGDDKADKAMSFLDKFSLLMRRMVDQTDIDYIDLKSEVDFLKGYIDLEKIRFEDKFDYKFDIQIKRYQEIEIPTFLLQPIIENSIQHGFKNKKGNGFLTINIEKNNGVLNIVIKDNGVGYNRTMSSISASNKKHKSKGIETIMSRIKNHNNDSSIVGFEIKDISTSDTITGTIVTVNIKIKNNEGNNS